MPDPAIIDVASSSVPLPDAGKPETQTAAAPVATIRPYDRVRADLQAMAAYDVVAELSDLLPDDIDDVQARAILMSAFVPYREAAKLCGMNHNTLRHWIVNNQGVYDQIRTLGKLVIHQQAEAVAYMGIGSLKALMASLPTTSVAWDAEIPDAWDRVKAVVQLSQTLKSIVELCGGEAKDPEDKPAGANWAALKSLAGKKPGSGGRRIEATRETVRVEERE